MMVIPMAKKQNKEIELQKVYQAAPGSHISDEQEGDTASA